MRVRFALLLLLLAPTLAPSATPDLSGVWRVTADVRELKTTAGGAPPLLPAAQKVHDQRRAQLKSGDASFDATQRCKPMGQPRIMYDSREFPFEIVQQGRKLLFAYQWNRQPRFVYMDEPMTAISPVFYGYASGHWNGDTLEVQTTGLDDATLLDRSGLPHSDALRLTERYRLQDGGKQLEARFTFDDPRTFSQPWEARVRFERVPDGRIREDICVDRLGLFRKNK